MISLGRRRFLGGGAALVALPWLESLAPRRARAARPTRLLFYYVPCGIHMAGWTSAAAGPDYALTPLLEPLAPFRKHLLVVSGLANMKAKPDGAGDHASGTGAFLPCAHPKKTEGADIQNGISVDQVAANAIGAMTRFPSLQLGIDGGSSAGGCDSGYSCAYARNISWSGPSTPLPKLTNPVTIFDRLFQGTSAGLSAREAERRLRQRKSVLDFAAEDARRLSSQLARTDRKKLDEYLTGVRETERRVQSLASAPACPAGPRPAATPPYPEHVKLLTDLMVLAFQCDLTRVISFMLGNAGSNRSYPFLNITGGHHQLSHHQKRPENLAALQAIGIWEVQQLAYLAERLAAVDEGEGTLLDHSAVFFSSEITDGDAHNHDNMPVPLLGRAGGALRPGQHVRFPAQQRIPLANLYLVLLAAAGVRAESFGDSTGVLAGV